MVSMQFDIGSFFIGLAVLPATAALVKVAITLVSLFVLRTIAPDGCLVCDHRGSWKVGERSNAAYYLDDLRHDVLWRRRRWHGAAWRAHRWNSAWVDGGEEHTVSCDRPGCEILGVRGPYSDRPIAAAVGRQHELACHSGSVTTSVKTSPAKATVP
ncbi:hypothetical protein CXR34_09020 [Microbacterium hominis]|uniref:Uncharacterized protein n=2 Tax=Microbacterium hominis TaxID=162426 RepID=A0A2K9DQS1_9MICO|nr:hypothetical protein CXR34_09020 [Microbacterium hominis]